MFAYSTNQFRNEYPSLRTPAMIITYMGLQQTIKIITLQYQWTKNQGHSRIGISYIM